MKTSSLVTLSVVLLAGSASAGESRLTVERGDTLTEIAERHEVTVAQLRRWNGLEGDVIRIGQVLRVRAPGERYEVKRGDTLSGIAHRRGTAVEKILALNPGLDPNRIRIGQVIRVPIPERPPLPVKKPLKCPGLVVQIADHGGYRVRNDKFAWATAHAADAIRRGFSAVRIRHRHAPRVRVLDASRREGGPLGGHRSHRDGRDVDITYHQSGCGRSGCPIVDVSPSDLDVARQWTLLRYWLENDDVEYVFIDRSLQRVLYEHARKTGATKEELEEWFQYPRPAHEARGIIRHWDGHVNHLHVRFREVTCPDGCCDGGFDSDSGRRRAASKQRVDRSSG